MKKKRIFGKLITMIKAKTPIVGKKLIRAGAAFLGLAAAPSAIPAGTLPEVPQSWIEVLQIVLAIVGLIFAGAGAASTEVDPDKIT